MNRKLKIGTLTFHMAHNYGAMLQAYALPIAIQKLGYNCEVIDYRFSYIDSWSRIERLNDLVARTGLFGGLLRYAKRVVTGYYLKKNMHTRFDKFERKIIPRSKKIYRKKTQLNNMPYDVILFGSDQIWNSDLTNGIAEEYVGGFVCFSDTRKIAYAASCGTSDFRPESKEIYDECLRDYYAIGVREKAFQMSLCSRGYNVECVLDPTLLLTADDWKKIISKKQKKKYGKYLVLYAFDEDQRIYELVREYAEKKGLNIVAIAYEKKDSMYDMDVLVDCGPLEFLSLFANAEHIITASFHGTVFSIIFHKNFHCVPHPKYRERTDSLLEMLELENHNINELTTLQDIVTDWYKVDSILERKRNESLDFLKYTISGN